MAFASLFLGMLGSLGMAPYNIWPILLLSLSGFYLILNQSKSVRGSFFYGWLFGFGYFFAGLFWVKNALLVDGNPFSWIWPLAVAGLPSLLAFFTGVPTAIAKRLAPLDKAHGFLSLTACMAAGEWLRGFVFTGYPWNLYGYTWADFLPMVQTVAVGNIYYLTWMTIFWFCLPGFWLLDHKNISKSKKILGVFALVSFCACALFGYWRLQTPVTYRDDVAIRIVQPNIPQSEKWDRKKTAAHFDKIIELSRNKDGAPGKVIIVWPETALGYWTVEDPISMARITEMLKTYPDGAVLLTGLLRVEREKPAYYNSMVMIDSDGIISNIYDKSHLVPFGEYIPFKKWIPLEPVVKFNGFASGDGAKTFEALGIKYSPIICYEVIFPGKIVSQEDEFPDVLINITNDAWYGFSAGPHQHFTQAVFRAVEEGIPMVRAANTGTSGIITPLGQVYEKSNLFSDYEKKLAIPSHNVLFKHNVWFKEFAFIILILATISSSYLRERKKY